MVPKYKLSDVAKDFGSTVQEVSTVLEGISEGAKKPNTVLTEEELNVIFEYFTSQNAVSDFNAYFASAEKPKEKPVQENKTAIQQEKKIEKEAIQKEEKKPESAKKPERTEEEKQEKAAEKKQEEPKPQTVQTKAADQKKAHEEHAERRDNGRERMGNTMQQGGNTNHSEHKNFTDGRNETRSDTRTERKNFGENFGDRNDRKDSRGTQGNGRNQQSRQQKPQHLSPAQQMAQRSGRKQDGPTEQVVRRVDTRTVDVNLDKYNEHYDQLAPQQNKRSDSFQRKQKINQKSQQRAKQRYSTKKETEAQKLQRLALERARKQQLKVMIPDEIVVSELASRLKATVSDVIKKLMGLGVMAAQNQVIDFDTAAIVAEEMGAKVEKEVVVTIEERLIDDSADTDEMLEERSPVVVVMGHVDHGKTSLLDKIRHSSVTATEAGGITQHIGAYTVVAGGKRITFLDTPGHEAFTAMRARGAAVTDIVILVVAADDGIMPQTVESINHAKAAGVTVIVAINKMDKPTANPTHVMEQLTQYELVPEEWGGDTICVPVSALTGQGIEDLLENINLVAEVKELKANPNRRAKGVVIEARLDKGMGPVATILVQKGTLHQGDIVIAGTAVGRVRVMRDDQGRTLKEAGPSTPVEITGLTEVPAAGDIFDAVEDEKLARELAGQRAAEAKEKQFASYKKVTLDNLFSQIAEGERKELAIIVKADVQGSAEAVKQSLEKISNDEVRVRVIHAGVGAINKSDVMLANAGNAIIIGFNVRPDPIAKEEAAQAEVEMRMYRVIYDAINDVTDAMKGMLAPKYREVELGRAEVRNVFKISSAGTIAGCYVLEGKVSRAAKIRLVRDGIVITEDEIDSLRRFKDDVKEVAQGYECGIGLDKFSDIKEGDIFEAFTMEEYRD